MWPNPLATFTEEILNEKFHFLCSGKLGITFAKPFWVISFAGIPLRRCIFDPLLVQVEIRFVKSTIF